MALVHRFRLPAPIDETWTALTHLERIAPCIPGATIDSVSGSVFTGSVKVKIGPAILVYKGSGTFLQRSDRAHRAVIEASGTDRRGNGTAAVTFVVTLHGNAGVTDVEVNTDVAFSGRPAQFGRGVVEDVADKVFEQFASCLGPKFEEGIGSDSYDGPVDGQPSRGLAGVPEQDRDFAGAGVRYTPPTSSAQPHFDVVRTVLPVMLRRYGVYLAAGAALLWVSVRIASGGRRKGTKP